MDAPINLSDGCSRGLLARCVKSGLGGGDERKTTEALVLSHDWFRGDDYSDDTTTYEALALSTVRDSLRSSVASLPAVLTSSGTGRERSPFDSAKAWSVTARYAPALPQVARHSRASRSARAPGRGAVGRLTGSTARKRAGASAVETPRRSPPRGRNTSGARAGRYGDTLARWNHRTPTPRATGHRAGLKGAARSTR